MPPDGPRRARGAAPPRSQASPSPTRSMWQMPRASRETQPGRTDAPSARWRPPRRPPRPASIRNRPCVPTATDPALKVSPKKQRAAAQGSRRPQIVTMTGLLQVGNGGQVELAGHNEDLAAPVGAEPEQIDRGEAAVEPRGVVTGEGVAVTLVQAGVVVAEVQREHALGETEADVPGGVAGIGNAVGERRDAGPAGAGAVEAVAGAEEPVTDFG